MKLEREDSKYDVCHSSKTLSTNNILQYTFGKMPLISRIGRYAKIQSPHPTVRSSLSIQNIVLQLFCAQ